MRRSGVPYMPLASGRLQDNEFEVKSFQVYIKILTISAFYDIYSLL